MSEPVIDFYWDLGSTNTYFALKLLPPLAASYIGAKTDLSLLGTILLD